MASIARPALCVLSLLSAELQGQAVPVHREPRHRLVLDSGYVRILDVQISPHDTTLFHTHDTPTLFIAIRLSPTDFQVPGGSWQGTKATADPGWRPGDVKMDTGFVLHPVTHRVTNVGDAPFRLLAITSSSPGRTIAASGTEDELPGSVEASSSWFRQSRVQIATGDSTGWYASTTPLLLVQPLTGRTEVLTGEGVNATLDAPGGWRLLRPSERYRLRNTGSESVTVLAVQLR
jgi:hypothetical protein